MDYISLGQHVRKKRREKRWTQSRLAEAVGLSVSFMGHIERGSRKASLETLISICNALDVSPNFLLEDSLELSRASDHLTPQKRVVLRELVQHLSDNVDEWLESGELPDALNTEEE